MKIFDRIAHTLQGKTPDSHHMPVAIPDDVELPEKARILISELVKPLSQPDQDIINDLIALITSLASKPHPNLNVSQVLQTGQTLIHELVRTIPDPNQHLIDELLNIIVITATESKQGGAPAQRPAAPPVSDSSAHAPVVPDLTQTPPRMKQMQPQHETTSPTPSETSSQPKATQQATSPANPKPATEPTTENRPPTTPPRETTHETAPAAKEPPKEPPAPKPAAPPRKEPVAKAPGANKHMINLIMDQLKELVNITNALNTKSRENETKINNRIDSLSETIDQLQRQGEEFGKQLTDIEKNMDKFIGLYEIVTNQYNPFVEDDTAQQQAAPSSAAPPPAAQSAASSAPQQPPTQPQPPQQQTPPPSAPQQATSPEPATQAPEAAAPPPPEPSQQPAQETAPCQLKFESFDEAVKEIKSMEDDAFEQKKAQILDCVKSLDSMAPACEDGMSRKDYAKKLVKYKIKRKIAAKMNS
ncbi:MAG: flagella accessory protein C [Nanoarchaeota archaeon]